MIHQHQLKANNVNCIFFSLFPPLSAKICPMRSTDLKYLGYGFGIGALLASLFFAIFFFIPQFNASGGNSLFGVQDTPMPTITLMPTIQPTATP